MKVKVLKFLDIAVEYLIYGVIFFIPISITMVGTFAGMATVFFLIKTILSKDLTAIKSNKILFLFLLLFFIFMGLSLFNSGPFFAKSLKALLIKWGRFPLLLWAIIDTFQDTRRIVKAACVFLFSATLVGLTVFTQKFFGFEFLRGRASWGYSAASIGPFENPNNLAAYLTGVIPIVLSFGFGYKKRLMPKLCFLLITVVLILSSFWARSRGGWLGLVLGLTLIILLISHHRVKKWFGIICVTVVFFFIPAITAVIYFYKHGKDVWRSLLIYGAWDMIKTNPFFGKGVGTFMDYSSLYTKNFAAGYAHNCYLQMWAESGIFSLLCFLLLAGYVFYRSIRTSLKISVSLNFFLLIGLTGGLLGFLVHSFFEVHLYSFQLSFLFWVVLGLTVALSSNLDHESNFKS